MLPLSHTLVMVMVMVMVMVTVMELALPSIVLLGFWLLPLGHLPFPSPSFTTSDEGTGKCVTPSAFFLL